jgi:regulator of protease activity HflC (stomatin/prohibitin superfamily)
MKIDVSEMLRAVLVVDGRPDEYLRPGRYRRWALRKNLELAWFLVDDLVADMTEAQADLIPSDELARVEVGADERAVIYQKGRAVRWLDEGRWYVWVVDSSVRIERIDTSGVRAEPLKKDLRALAPSSDYIEITASNGCVAVRYVDGVLDEVLGAGRHAAWKTAREVSFAILEMRERMLDVSGQELMTKDRVTLRVNASAVYKIDDPRRLATVARDADQVLYLAVQMAVREAVSQRTLDQLLAARDVLAEEIFGEVKARASEVGLEVIRLGVKDLILPGEMKNLMNRVIEASKQAEASVILRREELAATRAMAQTAKLLDEQPVLMRLKELEAYKELATTVGSVNLVLGDNALKALDLVQKS